MRTDRGVDSRKTIWRQTERLRAGRRIEDRQRGRGRKERVRVDGETEDSGRLRTETEVHDRLRQKG